MYLEDKEAVSECRRCRGNAHLGFDAGFMLSFMEQSWRAAGGLKRTVLLDGVGHYVQQERPKEVTAAMLDFLKMRNPT
jgi:pimeloyl-ACP methyl ester carboxylesterase